MGLFPRKAFSLCLYFFLFLDLDLAVSQNFNSEPNIEQELRSFLKGNRGDFQSQDYTIDRNRLLEYSKKGVRPSWTEEQASKEKLESYLLENIIPFYLKEWLVSGKLAQLAEEGSGLFTGVGEDCALASKQWIKHATVGLLNGTTPTWAFQMIDAWGKFPEGVLSGHVGASGDFHECLQIRGNYSDPSKESQQGFFKGSYCTSYVLPAFFLEELSRSKASKVGNPNLRQAVSPAELLASITNLNSTVIMLPSLGMCFPSTCSHQDSQILMSNAMALAGNIIAPILLACYTDEKPDFDTADITMIVGLSIIGVLCVVGTLVDVLIYKKTARGSMSKSKETAYKVLVAFSLYTNIVKWSNVSVGKDNLGCLHGLRFFSMCWVVLCHTLVMYIMVPSNWNLIDMRNIYKGNWTIYALINGTPSVDTFFTMSGALVAYNLLKALDKQRGRVNIPLMYFHRFMRITPTYIIIVGMMATILPYISSGPMWYAIEAESAACAKNWWHNILYVNNLITYDAENAGCYGEAWYLANDMQFFWISPLLIYPLWRWKKIGLGLLGLFSVVSIVTPSVIAHEKKLPPTMTPFSNTGTYMQDIYTKPWTRIGPYLVGIFVGYVLHSMSVYPKYKWRLPKWAVLAGWTLSTVAGMAVIFGPASYFDPTNHEAATTSVGSAVYAGMHRYVWGIVIAWIIFACVQGYGGWVNDFLSWAPFVPLGRLTFCVYITSYHLQMIYHITVTTPTYYSPYIAVNLFFSHLITSLLVGFVLTIILESPFIQLEKIIFQQERARPSPQPVKNDDTSTTSSGITESNNNHSDPKDNV